MYASPDWIRFILATLVNIFITSTYTSPNEHQEMGSRPGDKVEKNEHSQLFWTRIIVSSISTMIYLLYGFNCAQYPAELSLLEYILFGLTAVFWMLRVWAYYTLGNLFTFIIGIREDHRLITTGPYRYLVHPSYTGQIGVYMFGLLFLRVHSSIIVATLIYIIYHVCARIPSEEKMMLRHFGDAYQHMLDTRRRLLPWIF
jgi:protein-S-isoprenylcysteine O-methyltransferase Ste14